MTVCVATGFPQIAATAVHDVAPYADRFPLAVPIGVWVTAIALIYISARYNMQADRYPTSYKKIVRQIGLLYPLYLIHAHVGGAVLVLAHRASIGFGSAVALAVLTSIAFSWLITVLPEPALKRLLPRCITPNSGRASRLRASVE